MGIRVDKKSLEEQAKLTRLDQNYKQFHHQILNKELPSSIGGGIGKSRINMFILEKVHIGEVQFTYWPKEHKKTLLKHGVKLLD